MSYSKTLGATLLVAGTAIGGGMLALPVMTGIYGFIPAVMLMISAWLVNTYIAFLLLEANLWLEPGSSIISMAKATLGNVGATAAWVSSILFLYTLLVAYISGLSEIILQVVTYLLHVTSPIWLVYCLVTALFASFIYYGARTADYANRVFSGGMILLLFVLLSLLLPHVASSKVFVSNMRLPLAALPVVFTSFGFMIVIPSIRYYLDSNVKQLKIAILVGSLIPLLLYILWEFFILGIISVEGEHGLLAILKQGDPGTGLTIALKDLLGNSALITTMRSFVFFAITTSFIGSSLGLFDLLSDGLRLKKNKLDKLKAVILTFILPLIFAMFFRKVFIEALGYAGVFSVVLLAVLPALMVWRGRTIYQSKVQFRTKGGVPALLMVFIFSAVLIIMQLMHVVKLSGGS